MALSAPHALLFLVSLVLAVLALLSALGVKLPGNNSPAIYVALVAYALLALGVVF
jgi:hypothetical protein